MMRLEVPYSVCSDPACRERRCTACSQTPPICSCCRVYVACPSTGETHPCRCTVRGLR
jgi:hypothetical protein